MKLTVSHPPPTPPKTYTLELSQAEHDTLWEICRYLRVGSTYVPGHIIDASHRLAAKLSRNLDYTINEQSCAEESFL